MPENKLTFVNVIHIGDPDNEGIAMNSLSEREQKRIGLLLNDKALRNLGYQPADEEAFLNALEETEVN